MLNSKPSSFKAYLLAARPKTLLAGMTPVLIALAYSFEQERLDLFLGSLSVVVVILLQIATNYVNDAYDALDGIDQIDRLGPERMTSLGHLSFAQMRWGYLSCFGLAFLIGIIIVIFTNFIVLALGLVAIVFAYIYTAGPFPLSRTGLGELAALVFFGPYAVFGTLYIQQHDYTGPVIVYSLLPGIASAMLMNINNLRDLKNDKAVNKTTLSTLVHEDQARWIPIILLSINLILVLGLSVAIHPVFLSSTLPWLVWLKMNFKIVLKDPIDKNMNTVLAKTGAALFAQGLILSGILIS